MPNSIPLHIVATGSLKIKYSVRKKERKMFVYYCVIFFWINMTNKLTSADIDFSNNYMENVAQNFGRCTTPNREIGLCTNLKDCQYLYNILLSPNLQKEEKLFLSMSQCGYHNGNVLICCSDFQRKASYKKASSQVTIGSRGNGLLPKPGTCGDVVATRIYGGNTTQIDEFPWMALIEYTKSRGYTGFHCGGSLINHRFVVTASHCVNGLSFPSHWKLSSVRLGEWNTTTNPDCEEDILGNQDCAPPHLDVPVQQTYSHPGYNPYSKNQANDIALLLLARTIAYTDYIRPICLPDSQYGPSNLDGLIMDVAGWGKTEFSYTSTVKLKADVEIINLDTCRKVYRSRNIKLQETQLCAGGQDGIDSCRGDSGGPLIALETRSKVQAYYYLAGIVSFGPTSCGRQGWPGVYTKVEPYINWIEEIIARH